MKPILQTTIAGTSPMRGKVRDIYDLGDRLLIVATDRISAFDVVMANGIPYKGIVLTEISKFWFDFLSGAVEHHLSTTAWRTSPSRSAITRSWRAGACWSRRSRSCPSSASSEGTWPARAGRSTSRARRSAASSCLPGSSSATSCPQPIFTPSTKAERGTHDENISFEQCAKIVGRKAAGFVRDKSIEVFNRASAYAAGRGILLADTKFEWGMAEDGRIILIDEVLTPDSSRFWPADKYAPGSDQESFDKQFVRNYLEDIHFNKSGPGVKLPPEVVQKTSAKYIEAFERLTGKPFAA